MESFCQVFCSDPVAFIGRWFFVFPGAALLFFAAAAAAARNLVHSALFATASFVALGVAFLSLGAEFVGFVQLLVYVGAVAMLIVFAILLTRPERLSKARGILSGAGPAIGAIVSCSLLAALLAFIFMSPLGRKPMPPQAHRATVSTIGQALAGEYVVPFIALGVLLTAALVGAAVIAMEDKEP